MAGSKNDVLVGKNADFSQAGAPNATTSEANGLVTNGQLWIGSTALNVGGTHVSVGSLTSPDGSLTFGYSSPNITAQVTGGASVGKTITGDSGGPLSPTAGNWNIFGQKANTTPVMDTIGSGSTLSIENRTWQTQYVVDPSATDGLKGTFTTIQSAINQAVADGVSAARVKTIFIRPGVYIENIVMPANSIHLTANTASGYLQSQTGTLFDVSILGNITFTAGGVSHFSNLNFLTSDGSIPIIVTDPINILQIYRCNIISSNATAISIASGVSFFSLDQSQIIAGNFAMSADASTCYVLNSSIIGADISAGVFDIQDSKITDTCTATNSLMNITNCYYTSLNIFINSDVGGEVTLVNTAINSNNATPITGVGIVNYGGLVFYGSSTAAISTTTQVPSIISNDAVEIKTPGAYPYTTVPQDAVIIVDTTSARTIIPLALPTTGQVHRIKDNTGLAGTNNITITPSGKNIDGAASYVITTNYGAVDIVYNGTQWNALPAGNFNISGGPGVTITGSGSAFTVNSVVFTDTTATTLVVDNGYFATAAGTYVLPASPAQGEMIIIVADTAGAVVVDAPGTQLIRLGSSVTSAGGTLTSTAIGDNLTLRYRSSNTTWHAVSAVGNWTVA